LFVLVALRRELDALDDFLGEELLLALVALLLQDLVKSVFDVFGEVEELHAELLNQHVILGLGVGGGLLAARLEGEEVLDEEVLNSREVLERYN